MIERNLISIALRFNEKINARDLTGLSDMMTKEHVFIDSSDETHKGRNEMILGWAEFFRKYPDYRNNFIQVLVKDKVVIMLGFSECSYDPLDGDAIWTAKIENGLVAEWRVYDDTPDNREKFSLSE